MLNYVLSAWGRGQLIDSAVKGRFDRFVEPVAQLVEHRTFNAVVAGSSPARLNIFHNLK